MSANLIRLQFRVAVANLLVHLKKFSESWLGDATDGFIIFVCFFIRKSEKISNTRQKPYSAAIFWRYDEFSAAFSWHDIILSSAICAELSIHRAPYPYLGSSDEAELFKSIFSTLFTSFLRSYVRIAWSLIVVLKNSWQPLTLQEEAVLEWSIWSLVQNDDEPWE